MERAGVAMFLSSVLSRIDIETTVANEFVASLLWFVDKDITSRPTTLTADYSTWSWLSVDGVVFNDSAGEVHETSALSVQELLLPESFENSEPMFVAGIKGLHLKLRGKIKEARWSAVPDQYYFARRRGTEVLCFSPPGYRDDELYYARMLQTKQRGNPGWPPHSKCKFEYLELVTPISNDPDMGPCAHTLQMTEGTCIGWLVPDTTDPLPDEIYCLQIRVEPVTLVEKHKLINTWAVRGLALAPVAESASQLPMYSRVGYFELDQKHNGFLYSDFAFDWKFPRAERAELWNSFLRELPDVDPTAYFEDVPDQDFILI